MRLAQDVLRNGLLVYLALGLVVLAIGQRKWWVETEELVAMSVEQWAERYGEKLQGRWLTATWALTIVGSLCFDVPLWPRAVWRWWLRGAHVSAANRRRERRLARAEERMRGCSHVERVLVDVGRPSLTLKCRKCWALLLPNPNGHVPHLDRAHEWTPNDMSPEDAAAVTQWARRDREKR